MIVLYQFPWSPYCLIQRRILEYSRAAFRIVNIPVSDRAIIWKLTRERYYQVPVIKEGRQVLFETQGDSQVLAKYLESRLLLGLFPSEFEGVQELLWAYFEDDVEGVAFKLTDIHWREFVPTKDRCGFLRHKERRFGRGCLDQWREQEAELLTRLEHLLAPAEQMLRTRPFLLASRPVFADFCLYGVLANFMYTGKYQLPAAHPRLREWYLRMSKLRRPRPA